ncbi:MAG TPA: type II toxin-antitoxin system prevent-host-death family antitoxin [Candidatus Binataceae bacterium]|nr:type II toxin-antitoxin system prevent-host-death family antitoxin [Candidatus Binataceae bacterium]
MGQFVNIQEATRFSNLLKRVELGEESIIARAGKPVARLVPFEKRSTRRKPGSAKGLIFSHDEFDDPLPPEIQKHFE